MIDMLHVLQVIQATFANNIGADVSKVQDITDNVVSSVKSALKHLPFKRSDAATYIPSMQHLASKGESLLSTPFFQWSLSDIHGPTQSSWSLQQGESHIH